MPALSSRSRSSCGRPCCSSRRNSCSSGSTPESCACSSDGGADGGTAPRPLSSRGQSSCSPRSAGFLGGRTRPRFPERRGPWRPAAEAAGLGGAAEREEGGRARDPVPLRCGRRGRYAPGPHSAATSGPGCAPGAAGARSRAGTAATRGTTGPAWHRRSCLGRLPGRPAPLRRDPGALRRGHTASAKIST